MIIKRVPFDPELERLLPNRDDLIRAFATNPPTADNVLSPGLSHEERTFPSPDGNTLIVSIFRKTEPTPDNTDPSPPKRIGIYNIHGGGMMFGNRFTGLSWPLTCVQDFNAVCVSIEYRLAPAHPDPAPLEDCYAGLIWMRDHADELGIDPTQIILFGFSAGAGLAVGSSLLYRDRKQSPPLFAQALISPMIDDRNNTGSAHAFTGVDLWDRNANAQGWGALLGNRARTDDVSIYSAPARAPDFSGLPTTYIDVGSAETFRDEDVALAQKLWRDGVQCELHVWAGGYHGFEGVCPQAELSKKSARTRTDWFRKLVSL